MEGCIELRCAPRKAPPLPPLGTSVEFGALFNSAADARVLRLGREALNGAVVSDIVAGWAYWEEVEGSTGCFGSRASLNALLFIDSDVLDTTMVDSVTDDEGAVVGTEEEAEEEAGFGDAPGRIFDFGLADSMTMLRAFIQSPI